jgi:hypothetical protein
MAVDEYGTDFYVLKFDFKSFFDSIPHKTCINELNKMFTDKRIVGFIIGIIKSYQLAEADNIEDETQRSERIRVIKGNQSYGICLGSQISQDMALVVPNDLDHFIKDKCSVKYYERYMDDGIIFHNDINFLWSLYGAMKELVEGLGLQFNDKKTYITKSTKGFTFMKVKYYVSKQDAKIIRKLDRSGITRMRKKLKKYRRLVDLDRMTLDDVYASIQSWLEHSKIADSYHAERDMLKLYDKLFGGYKLTRYWKHSQTRIRQEQINARKEAA